MKLFNIFERLRDVEDDASTSINDDMNLLDGGEEEEEGVVHPPGEKAKKDAPKEEAEEEEGEEVEDDEEVDDEDSEEEESEEESEEEAPNQLFTRPSIQDITKTYPDIFKKFPELRDMYYREREFNKIFPTIDEAKEANDNSTSFTNLRENVMAGDGSLLFSAIKEAGEDELMKFASSILPNLHKVSEKAHWEAATPLMQNIVQAFYREGTKLKDDSIKNAALHLAAYLFNDQDVATGKTSVVKSREESPAEHKLKTERAEFETRQYNVAFSAVGESASKSLRKLIDSEDKNGKSRIDPDEVFSPFIKNRIIQEVVEQVGRQMSSDTEHMRLMDTLWSKAKKDGYSEKSKATILSAYLARAKSLVPSIRAGLLAEANGSASARDNKRGEKARTIASRREHGTGGRPSRSTTNGYVDPKKVDWGKTSDMDILNETISYRK